MLRPFASCFCIATTITRLASTAIVDAAISGPQSVPRSPVNMDRPSCSGALSVLLMMISGHKKAFQ